MKKVLVAGVFDILHTGHLYFLKQAKELGDWLMVVVASDTTARLSGKKLVFSQKERQLLIASLRIVDEAILGEEKRSWINPVKKYQPKVIALGFDQKIKKKELADELKRIGWQGQIIRMKPSIPPISSSQIKEKIVKNLL